MTEQPRSIAYQVDGIDVTAIAKGRTSGATGATASTGDKPLIVALHGGTYDARYFDVDGSGHGSLMDLAAALGHEIISVDRPGYGGSTALDPADNTFERHAELLNAVIAQAAAGRDVVLVGHSIGGMITLMIAGRRNDFRLVGVSVTGMGAVIRAGGPAEQLASLPPDLTMDLPYDHRDQVMFGPAGTWTDDAVRQAHSSYAPVPVRELIQAPRWPRDILPALAPLVDVPVHNALAEHDALWDSSPENVARFAALFTAAPSVEAAVAHGTGHSIDHHRLGHATHLRQLAFAAECAFRARADGHADDRTDGRTDPLLADA